MGLWKKLSAWFQARHEDKLAAEQADKEMLRVGEHDQPPTDVMAGANPFLGGDL
jgi:hypothetical protein